MPETDFPMHQVLLATALALLILLVLLVWRISRRLARIERRLDANTAHSETDAPPPSAAETSAGGAFEMFLNEDPARRDLPKNEQFAAYRKWRQEKGLNWSGS